jgi:hypothetical protein
LEDNLHFAIGEYGLLKRMFLKFLLDPKIDEGIRRYALRFGNRLNLFGETFFYGVINCFGLNMDIELYLLGFIPDFG